VGTSQSSAAIQASARVGSWGVWKSTEANAKKRMNILSSPIVKTAIIAIVANEIWYNYLRPMVFRTAA
jgi:hypothetical protein